MPFREKSAWISLVCLVATFGVFFFCLFHGLMQPGMESLHYFLMAVMGFVALQVLLHVIAILLAPRDFRTPKDERERLISLKAMRNAYVVLVVGVFFVPLSMHTHHQLLNGEFAMPWIALGALFIAELVRTISKIVFFRRGR